MPPSVASSTPSVTRPYDETGESRVARVRALAATPPANLPLPLAVTLLALIIVAGISSLMLHG